MSFWKWSRTAGTNSTADGSISWAEGQAPSSVNDSARAMMAASAKFRDDISGAIATGGTSTAYTVTSYQVFDTLAHLSGNLIAFTPHATNGDTVTLNVDGLGAKPLRSAPSVELPAGTLILGSPYTALYNASDAVFYLSNFFVNPYQIPLGGMMPYIGATAPNSAFVLPYGQAISRTTYATLFSLVSTTFGVGNGSTTFNVIDMRGRLPIGKDDMGGSAASRVTTAGSSVDGTTIGATGGAQTVTVAQANLPNVSPTFTGNAGTPAGTVSYSSAALSDTGVEVSVSGGAYTHSSSTTINDPGAGGTQKTVVTTSSQSTVTATAHVGSPGVNGAVTVSGLSFTGSSLTPAGTISALGSGTAVNKMPPGIVVPYILRVI